MLCRRIILINACLEILADGPMASVIKFLVLLAALFIIPLSSAVSGSTINPGLTPLANNTLPSGGLLSNITILPSAHVLALNPAIMEALKEGPMVYAATTKSVLVIDSSTLSVVSSIKPDVDTAHIYGVAVSPDGQFVYIAYSWAVHQQDPYGYGEGYNQFARVVRINASSQQPIDYYELDGIEPEHLAVSPDGRVYLGYQKYGYPENGGIRIMDFQQGKMWNIDMKYITMMYDIEFSPDGNKVYYSGWWDAPSVYELDWNANTVHYNKLPGNASSDYYYARSVAVGRGGTMLYATMTGSTGIFAMNTQDHGKQVIPTGYYPIALAASPDGETLYAIGYFYDTDNKPIYLIHKYSGLKTVGPLYSDLLDYMVISSDSFYTYDATSYITPPSGDKPSRIAVTSDGRFAYISTIAGDGGSNVYGDGVILYDLQYMSQVKTFDATDSLHDVAVSPSKILFSPPPDYGWLQSSAGSIFHGTFTAMLLVPTSFHPANGTFAKGYDEDLFSIYATFSDLLDNTTVNSNTFWLSDKAGNNVSAKVVAASKLAILSPDSQLAPNTDYVAHLSKEIRSKDGKQLYADVEWGFTTKSISRAALLPINTLLNLTSARRITSLPPLNISMPPEANNSSRGIHLPPPQAQQPQNQSGNQTQNQTQNQTPGQTQGTGQPAIPPLPGQNLSEQPNVSNQQPAANATNVTQPPVNQSLPGSTPPSAQPPAQSNDILSIIISFFKSLFGMK